MKYDHREIVLKKPPVNGSCYYHCQCFFGPISLTLILSFTFNPSLSIFSLYENHILKGHYMSKVQTLKLNYAGRSANFRISSYIYSNLSGRRREGFQNQSEMELISLGLEKPITFDDSC